MIIESMATPEQIAANNALNQRILIEDYIADLRRYVDLTLARIEFAIFLPGKKPS